MNNLNALSHSNDSDIAIIGMTGRFPKGRCIDEFWQNLRNGVESISFFEQQSEESSKIFSVRESNYIKAAGILEDIELFDAAFFGFSSRIAEITDPQHRIFLECAWEALENAGYNPELYQGLIGVYAGASLNTYFLLNLASNSNLIESVGFYPMLVGNDKDFLTTRVSYLLNLKGPSVTVQTACSTSLVATHLACQSLLSGECDMVLVGGVSVKVPDKTGYLYQEGGILSPDGHCRAFDAKACGTVVGSGVGIVVLKRLADALADGDYIHAVIKGSAISNDGSSKVSYTAPSVDGQAETIAEALAMANVKSDTISYIEAHGTGTLLGDPIEIAALTQVFRNQTEAKGFCAIGSVKTNIGHLDAASGVAGLIKTVLSLKHKLLPPSLHLEQPNPKIDFANSPFYVNNQLSEWKRNNEPRRAGVSSFGIGGTNAHIILEEAPPTTASETLRPYYLLVISAKTSSALEMATTNLVRHLKQHSDINLADVAYTYHLGRKTFNHRRMVVCHNIDDAVTALDRLEASRVFTNFNEERSVPIAFMFPGQGTQYVNMALELYQIEPTFREEVDICSEILKPHLGLDLRHILYPDKFSQETTQTLKQTSIAQPALFIIEYALAKLWMKWGITPQAMIGHSIGEYVVACLAGVFSLEDALTLVVIRGKLMQELPTGGMLAVPLPEAEVTPLLGKQLSKAAINGLSLCTVSGPKDALQALDNQLSRQGINCRYLHTSHAFHSHMMEPIVDVFAEYVKKVKLNLPTIPYISNSTGTWITVAQATDPNYWAQHLRETVRFVDGMQELLKQQVKILLEVGPGQTLNTLTKQYTNGAAEQVVLSSLQGPNNKQSDIAFLLNTLGQLWLAGVQVDWSNFYAHERRHRLPLPTYPFERQRYWIEPQKQATEESQFQTNPTSSTVWQSVIKAGQEKSQQEFSQFENSTHIEKVRCLDELCIAYMNHTLKGLGAFSTPQEKYSIKDLFQKFHILPRYQQLISRWLQVLVTHNALEQHIDTFSNLLPLPANSLNALAEEFKVKWSDTPQLVDLVQNCGEKLSNILIGEEDPLRIIFREGSFDKIEGLAQNSPFAHYFNGILRASLAQAVKLLPPEVNLRVLEIGAGTGGTTAWLLPILPPKQTSYTYTDVSSLFLQRAKQKFAEYPFINYRLLDIEKHPEKQGYKSHSFDVIVAANVLHVTRNMRETVQHIRSLLAPEGLLLMWEITQPQLYFDMTLSLVMNQLEDEELRQGNPFLSKKQWRELLQSQGFVEVAEFPEAKDFGLNIIMSQASSTLVYGEDRAFTNPLALQDPVNTANTHQVSLGKKPDIMDWFYLSCWEQTLPNRRFNRKTLLQSKSCWLVFTDECGLGYQLVKRLAQEGQDVTTVIVGERFAKQDDDTYSINPLQINDYNTLLQELQIKDKTPRIIVHLWSVTASTSINSKILDSEVEENLGFCSFLLLIQAIGAQNIASSLQIRVISNNMQEVTSDEELHPEKATILGLCKVVPQEYPNITCQSIDVVVPESETWQTERLIVQLFEEVITELQDLIVAYRGNYRWIQTLKPYQPTKKLHA